MAEVTMFCVKKRPARAGFLPGLSPTKDTHCQSASRMPENCQRVSGEKKFRYEERMCGAGVTHDPPRRYKLATHELAVVLAQRSGQGTKAGIAKIGARVPLPAIAEHLRRALEAGSRRGRCGCHWNRPFSPKLAFGQRFVRRRGHQPAAVEQIAAHQVALGGGFPFRFRGQPPPRPARVRIRLVVAQWLTGAIRMRARGCSPRRVNRLQSPLSLLQ